MVVPVPVPVPVPIPVPEVFDMPFDHFGTGFFLSSFQKWREEILRKEAPPVVGINPSRNRRGT
jgi:hypothetical protein